MSETLQSPITEILIPLRKPKSAELYIPIQPERRRTPRQHVPVPLFVYGYAPEGHTFYERTATITVNVHGGSMRMETPVQLGQRLLVTNRENECSQPCIIVFVDALLGGGFEVAFSFTAAMMHFWEKPRRSKAPERADRDRADEAKADEAPGEIELHCHAVEFAQQ